MNSIFLDGTKNPDYTGHVGIQDKLEGVVSMATTLVTRTTTGRLDKLYTVTADVHQTLEGFARFAGGGGGVGKGCRTPVKEGQIVRFSKQVSVVATRVEVLPAHDKVGTEVAAGAGRELDLHQDMYQEYIIVS